MNSSKITLAILFVVLATLRFGAAQVVEETHIVSPKNGTFYIAFRDVVLDGSVGEYISRTYSSRTTRVGIFGFGWGCRGYATRLIENPDGSVNILLGGVGFRKILLPSKVTTLSDDAADTLIAELRKLGEFSTEDEESGFRKILLTNEELRSAYFIKYNRVMQAACKQQDEHQTWTYKQSYAGNNFDETIDRTRHGFLQKYGKSLVSAYNVGGQQTRVDSLNAGHGIILDYDPQERLRRIVSTANGKSLNLSYGDDDSKLVKQIRSENDVVTYQYDDDQNLISVTDSRGLVHSYSYDKNHNLTRVGYPDGTEMLIEYGPKTQFTSKVTKPNEDITDYTYDSDPENPNYHYWTAVANSKSKSKLPDRYEYWIEKTPGTGIQYNRKTLTRIDDVETLTTNNPSDKPIHIRKGDTETTFEYDSELRLLKKESSDGTWLECECDPIHKKLSRATTESGVSTFTYNEKGQLNFANKGEENEIEIRHNQLTRIVELLTSDQRISLSYGHLANNPVLIELPRGTIEVEYNDQWELKSLNSNVDPESIRKQIEPLQDILKTLEPVGNTLNLEKLVELFSADAIDELFNNSSKN